MPWGSGDALTSTNLNTTRPTWSATSPYFDVTQYGAKGDGVTDDSAAIQAAINAAQVNVRGVVFLPIGKYRLSSGLTMSQSGGVRLLGSSTLGSRLLPDAGVTALTISCPIGGCSNSLWSDFCVIGGARGIYVTDGVPGSLGLSESAFARILLTQQTGEGFFADTFEIIETLFDNVTVDSSGTYGMHLQTSFNGVVFVACQFTLSSLAGMWIQERGGNLGAVTLISCVFESNKQVGLKMTDMRGAWLEGCLFGSNGTSLVGGPYPHCVITATVKTTAVNFAGCRWSIDGANDGQLAVQVQSDLVQGPLSFFGCIFQLASNNPVGKVDVGAFATIPGLLHVGSNPGPVIVGTPPSTFYAPQTTVVSGGAAGAASGTATSGGWGFVSAAEFNAFVSAVNAAITLANNERTALVNHGVMS